MSVETPNNNKPILTDLAINHLQKAAKAVNIENLRYFTDKDLVNLKTYIHLSLECLEIQRRMDAQTATL